MTSKNDTLSTRTCKICSEEKAIDDFRLRKKGRAFYRLLTCTVCERRIGKKYHSISYARQADKYRAYARARYWTVARKRLLLRKYGITEEEYGRLHDAQRGVCGICGKEQSRGRLLAVDHDHETGAVRGLLCDSCNQALGKLGDTLESLQRVIGYLTKPRET